MMLDPQATQALRNARAPMAVLFVDPDLQGAQQLARALPAQTISAVVPSATAALHAMRDRVPTLIVTELNLPDVGGIEFLARIHSAPATRKVLLLVVTTRTEIRSKIAAFEAGADDYLVKPLDPQQFVLHVQLLNRFRQLTGT
jgi:DNA-binding response OmpR family regulator